MTLVQQNPTAPIGLPGPAARRDLARSSTAAVEHARRNLLIAQIAGRTSGSLAEKRRVMEALVSAGVLTKAPSRSWIRHREAEWHAGRQSLEDFLPARALPGNPQPGRRPAWLPKVLEDRIADEITRGTHKNAASVQRAIEQTAKDAGVPVPSLYLIRKRMKHTARIERAAAAHGRRAGEIDAQVRSRVVSAHSHHTWALDEGMVPVWIRRWEPRLSRWVSVLVDVVLIIDVRSTAVIGWYIADPTYWQPVHPMDRRRVCDRDDVLAALLSAAVPELAPASTRTFAGYLPTRLRMDNAAIHKALLPMLGPAGLGLELPELPVRRAVNNGAVERRVQIVVKEWVNNILGYMEAVLPTDRLWTDYYAEMPRTRTEIAGKTTQRMPVLDEIAPENLYSYDELCEHFGRVVHRYNTQHVNRILGSTAEDEYHRRKPTRLPRGRGLVLMLEPKTTVVRQDGILAYKANKEFAFATRAQGLSFDLDTAVTFRADPLMRGIFVELLGQQVFLPPMVVWAADQGATAVARLQAAEARAASERGHARRRAMLEAQIGRDGMENSEASAAAGRAAFRAYKAGESELPALHRHTNSPPPPPTLREAPAEERVAVAGQQEPAKPVDPTVAVVPPDVTGAPARMASEDRATSEAAVVPPNETQAEKVVVEAGMSRAAADHAEADRAETAKHAIASSAASEEPPRGNTAAVDAPAEVAATHRPAPSVAGTYPVAVTSATERSAARPSARRFGVRSGAWDLAVAPRDRGASSSACPTVDQASVSAQPTVASVLDASSSAGQTSPAAPVQCDALPCEAAPDDASRPSPNTRNRVSKDAS